MIPPRISNSLEADLGSQHNYTAGRGSSHNPVQEGTLKNNTEYLKKTGRQLIQLIDRVLRNSIACNFFVLKFKLLQSRD